MLRQCCSLSVFYSAADLKLAQCQHGGVFESVFWCITHRCQFRDVLSTSDVAIILKASSRIRLTWIAPNLSMSLRLCTALQLVFLWAERICRLNVKGLQEKSD